MQHTKINLSYMFTYLNCAQQAKTKGYTNSSSYNNSERIFGFIWIFE